MKFVQSAIMIAALGTAIVSCKKETVTQTPTPTPVSPLEAVIKFNNNLSDSTGKVSNGVVTGTATYVNDRNGNANSALFLDGSSKVVFSGLNLKGKSMTMSAWVKYFNAGGGLSIFLTAIGGGSGPALTQISDKFGSSISVPGTNSVESNTVNSAWHHVAVTYNGTDIKLYIDGVYTTTTNHPGTMGDGTRDMILGVFNSNYWKGYIDDLRVYNTVMTDTEVAKLTALN